MTGDEETDELAALQQEVTQLRTAVVSHAVIDQAIGVVICVWAFDFSSR